MLTSLKCFKELWMPNVYGTYKKKHSMFNAHLHIPYTRYREWERKQRLHCAPHICQLCMYVLYCTLHFFPLLLYLLLIRFWTFSFSFFLFFMFFFCIVHADSRLFPLHRVVFVVHAMLSAETDCCCCNEQMCCWTKSSKKFPLSFSFSIGLCIVCMNESFSVFQCV